MPGPAKIIDDFAVRCQTWQNHVIEQRIQLVLRPAPRWMPRRCWLWLAARFIELRMEAPHWEPPQDAQRAAEPHPVPGDGPWTGTGPTPHGPT